MRHGKRPTRAQKIRLGQAGLSPENWLVIRQKQNGELVIIHKHRYRIKSPWSTKKFKRKT